MIFLPLIDPDASKASKPPSAPPHPPHSAGGGDDASGRQSTMSPPYNDAGSALSASQVHPHLPPTSPTVPRTFAVPAMALSPLLTDTQPPLSVLDWDSDGDDELGASASTDGGAPVEWDWDAEHADRARERAADDARGQAHAAADTGGLLALPLQVDRRVLRDVVRERAAQDVGQIAFMGAGTFNKAYLVTLSSGRVLVARVARRLMPRLKVASEVATLRFLRHAARVPVPGVLAHDANPYNRLGGEYILMARARGVALRDRYHALSYAQLGALMDAAARILVPLFALRFPALGSLYDGPDPAQIADEAAAAAAQSVLTPTAASFAPTPTAASFAPTPTAAGFFSPAAARTPGADAGSVDLTPRPAFAPTPRLLAALPAFLAAKASGAGERAHTPEGDGGVGGGGLGGGGIPAPLGAANVHVGPVVSWPFFGSGRGELAHPAELDRGPWRTTRDYLRACAAREVDGVVRENEGRAAPHRLHLDPDEIRSSRHHKLKAVPGDESDDSTEWDWEESERAWDDDGPGDAMYSDYRRMQRGTFLFAHTQAREAAVRADMERWVGFMERLGAGDAERLGAGDAERLGAREEFALDCHDLSLENVFVAESDPTKITCIIDWESTTTRPLWAAAHVPAFAQSSPFTAKLYRAAVARLASTPSYAHAAAAAEWLHHEHAGARLRAAHRVAEWDGWEEGLVGSIIGPEHGEAEWMRDWDHADDEDDDADEQDLRDAPHVDGLPAPDSPPPEHPAAIASDEAGAPAYELGPDDVPASPSLSDSRSSPSDDTSASKLAQRSAGSGSGGSGNVGAGAGVPERVAPVRKRSLPPPRPEERAKERGLEATGDTCGGRGGELGRRLEAWLYDVHGEEVQANV